MNQRNYDSPNPLRAQIDFTAKHPTSQISRDLAALRGPLQWCEPQSIERRLEAMRRPIPSSRESEALKAFGLPSDLPYSTHGKTTIRGNVTLPAEMTETYRRAQEMGRK